MTGLESVTTKQNMYQDRSEHFFRSALLLVDSGDYANARTLFGKVLSNNPHHLKSIRWLAYCLEKLGDIEAAKKCYHSALKNQPNEEFFFELAQLYNKQMNFPEAKDHYLQSLDYAESESPFLFDTYKNLGNIYLREGDLDTAEECYNRAYTIRSDSDALNVNYGILEIQRQNMSAAGERFRAALQKNMNNDGAWVGLAMVHRGVADSQLGWANLTKALDVNPANRTALQLCLDWGVEDEMLDKPLHYFEKYLARHPEDLALTTGYAGILFSLGQKDLAKLEIEKVLAFDSSYSPAIQLKQKMGFV